MKKIFCFLLLITNILFATEKITVTAPTGVLIANPNIVDFHVAAPKRFKVQNAQTASVNINFLPADSPDARWGDHATSWPDDAKAAFTYAAEIWGSIIKSSVPVTIDAAWVDNMGPGVLGHSGALFYYNNFSGATMADTFYPVALANSLHGSDLNTANADIYMGFSSKFSWYTSTDGNTPNTKYDLASVVLHEICHGLGFAGNLYVDGGVGKWWSTLPYPYDHFTEDNSGTSLIDTSAYPKDSVTLKNALTSEKVYFNGTYANVANGNSRVKLYCPSIWQSGSSYSHLGEIFNNTPNALMTYSLGFGESEHSPGPVTEGLLKDIGWQVNSSVGTSAFTTTKFKGKITWKEGDKYQLGNLKIVGSMDSSLVDLSFLSGESFTNLIILNGSMALPCGEFSINKKGTVAKAKTNENDNKISAKFKLKKGKLYFTYINKNCSGLPSALNISNIETTDWILASADLYISVVTAGNTIFGEGTTDYNYKTKIDKKTTFK